MEETGHISILNELQLEESTDETVSASESVFDTEEPSSQFIEDLDLKVEASFDIEQVATEVTTYVQTIIDDMDVEATISMIITVVASICKLIQMSQGVLSVIMVKY